MWAIISIFCMFIHVYDVTYVGHSLIIQNFETS